MRGLRLTGNNIFFKSALIKEIIDNENLLFSLD